jgi:DNA-binding transcriptional MerR regulator
MNIGEVVRLIGLSEHTLRYYEKVGLLPPIGRDASGNRLFTPEDLRWLEFLVKLRQTRMPLRQMLRYAGLVRQGNATLGERRAMLEAHERQVRATIVQMNECLGVLQTKLDLYRQWEREAAAD